MPSCGTRWLQHLSEAEDQWVLLGCQSDSIAVAHGEVDLATVTPQGRRVGWHPSGEQPGTDNNTTITPELIQEEKMFPTAKNISHLCDPVAKISNNDPVCVLVQHHRVLYELSWDPDAFPVYLKKLWSLMKLQGFKLSMHSDIWWFADCSRSTKTLQIL